MDGRVFTTVCLLWRKLKIFIICRSVLFVCEYYNSQTLSAIFVKLYQRIPKDKSEAVDVFWQYGSKVTIIQRSPTLLSFENPHFSSDWVEIWTGFAHQVTEFNHQLFKVNTGQKVNIFGVISEIVIFHLINLKFEEDFHLPSINSTTNYFKVKFVFMGFASVMLCTTPFLLLAKIEDFSNILDCLFALLPPPPKVKEILFSTLSVCVQDISKSCGRIWMKFCGQVGSVTSMNWLDFGADLNPDPTTIIFFTIEFFPTRSDYIQWFFTIER